MVVVLWQYNYKSPKIIYDFCLHGWWGMSGAILAGTDTLKMVSLYGMCIPASLVEYSGPVGKNSYKRGIT